MLAQCSVQHHIRRPDHRCRVPLPVPQPVQSRSPTAVTDSARPRSHHRHPSRRGQIPIAPEAPSLPSSRGFLPWRLSNAGPSACGTVREGPASETLHNSRHQFGERARRLSAAGTDKRQNWALSRSHNLMPPVRPAWFDPILTSAGGSMNLEALPPPMWRRS
jgi:hypothetical protein